MTYCQAMTGSGGWPLTIIMAHDQRPFFAGTYFPKKSRRGMPGLIDILKEIALIWKNDRSKLYEIRTSRANYSSYFSIEKGQSLYLKMYTRDI